MSPTVPPISEMTTSVSVASDARRIRSLISFVMCGITWTVEPRYSPFRSLRSTEYQIAACGVVRVARQVLVDEALVVADVEIRLGAVLGDEDLAVLERAHRARVDVDVRVELLHLHLQAARLEQPAERGRDDALAEGRDDAAGDEDVLRRARHAAPPERGRAREGRASARSGSPRETDSPRRVSPASAPIATARPRPVSRPTDFNPSSAPRPFEPASPSIPISRRS